MHELSINKFIFDIDNSKDQGKNLQHIDSEYLGNGENMANITNVIQLKEMYGLSIGIFTFDRNHF